MKAAGLSWLQRQALKAGRGGVVDLVKKLFTGKPGLLRGVLLLYVVAIATLYALGYEAAAVALGSLGAYVGVTPENTGLPVPQTELTAMLLAVVAAGRLLLRHVPKLYRWAIGQ
jgi:hypothetical protein